MKKIIQLLIINLTTIGLAQDGSLDLSFNPSTGVNNAIYSTTVQSDGKVVVGGDFTLLNNTAFNKLGRLNVDGTLDLTFNIGSGFSNSVYSINIQPDGKIIVGGNFTAYNGATKNRIVRLNADGTIDSAFNVGTGANGTVYSSVLQSDGKIIVAGNFTTFNGVSKNRIVRLNVDGTLDSAFNIPTGANGSIYSCVMQSDGKIIIGGSFTTFNGISRQRIARLNSDGTLDSTFNAINAADNTIRKICLQSDEKIIIGGEFTSYNGTSVNRIARLNSDSTIDTTFNSGTGFDYVVYSIATQFDGKIIVVGDFMTYNGFYRNRIVQLNTDGTLDTTFNSSGSAADNSVKTVSVRLDGKIIIGGNFTHYNTTLRNRLVSINTNGSTDVSFYPFLQSDNTTYGFIRTMALQSDEKIIIGGLFQSYNGIVSTNIARLNSDGFLDTSFNVGTGANGLINKIMVLSNNKIIIVGDFTAYNGIVRNRIAQLNADGTLDATFNPGSGANNSVTTVSIQTDGKIIIGGDFTAINGIIRNQLARLNANGSLDTSFDSGTNIGGNIKSTAVQPDGKIIIGGLSDGAVARLNVNGALDTTFNAGGAGADYFVYSISIQTDGKIIIGGGFDSYNDVSVRGVVRLNADGSLDTTFNAAGAGINIYGVVYSSVIQNDGKIIIAGGYNTYNDITSKGITRLNTDGTIDSTFITGTGFDGVIESIVLQNDGKVLASGNFNIYNNIEKSRIARLNNTSNLGLDDFYNNPQISVYPNPVSDYLQFKLPNDVNVFGFNVFDLGEKKVDSDIVIGNSINVSAYSKGIYILNLITNKGVLTSKFIKN